VSVPREVDDFLTAHTRTMLVTVRSDGFPTIHPMVGMWSDGALWFNTYRKSAKVRNIERDPRVCCVVVGGTDDLARPAVVLHGHAQVMPPGTPIPRVGGTAPATAPAGVTGGIVRKVETRVAENRRIMVRVEPTHAELHT
jgi:hypothetical protein